MCAPPEPSAFLFPPKRCGNRQPIAADALGEGSLSLPATGPIVLVANEPDGLVLVDRGLAGGRSPDLNESGLPSRRNNRGHPVRYPLAPSLERNPRQGQNQDHHVGTRGFGSAPLAIVLNPHLRGPPEGDTTEMRRSPAGADDASATSRSQPLPIPDTHRRALVLLAKSNVPKGETWFRSAAALILDRVTRRVDRRDGERAPDTAFGSQ